MPDYFMVFDKNRMPLAVFYTETEQEAIRLLSRLYQKSWAELSSKHSVTITKETDVAPEEWERICNKPCYELVKKQKIDTEFRIQQDFVIEYLRSRKSNG